MGNLIHRGFVTETGWQRLPDLLRYLRAIERRLEKLAIDPNRDRVYMLKVHSVGRSTRHCSPRSPNPS